MNRYTKRSLIFSILTIASIIVGLLIFIIVGNATLEAFAPTESNDTGAQLGTLIVFIGIMIQIWIVFIIDLIFSSALVYTFAHFSRKNAILALKEETDKTTLPKVLRVVSFIEMILSGTVGIIAMLIIPILMIMTA